jgi:hypothetical protein
MIVKKTSPASSPANKQLEFLYARRLAIDSLIESLEKYDRLRVKLEEIRPRKTA